MAETPEQREERLRAEMERRKNMAKKRGGEAGKRVGAVGGQAAGTAAGAAAGGAAGAGIGAVSGAISGLAAGGVGAIPGAIAGAARGGATGARTGGRIGGKVGKIGGKLLGRQAGRVAGGLAADARNMPTRARLAYNRSRAARQQEAGPGGTATKLVATTARVAWKVAKTAGSIVMFLIMIFPLLLPFLIVGATLFFAIALADQLGLV